MKKLRDGGAPWVRLSQLIAETMGLHFAAERLRDLKRGVTAAAKDFGFTDPVACVEWLLAAPLHEAQLDILARHLTVGETYFFREQRTFEALGTCILPELIAARTGGARRLRLWSAACCTGEEAYSLAILLHRLLPDIAEWQVTILATDINAAYLRRAAAGTFSTWSFRGTPSAFRARYFEARADGRYDIRPQFKRLVTFEHLNLVADRYPSLATNTNAMDVILCRNVLMYFTPDQIAKVVLKLHHSLVDGGWLAVAPSEASHVLFNQFATRTVSGAILYQKIDLARQPGRQLSEATALAGPYAISPGLPSIPMPLPASPSPQQLSASITDRRSGFPDPHITAALLYEQGDYAGAAATLLSSPASGNPTGRTFSLLARSLANTGKLPEATHWCERWIAADRLNAAAHYVRAVVLLEEGRLDQARRSLRRTLYLEPDFVLVHFALGNIARTHGLHPEAQRHFANTIRLLEQLRSGDILPESDGLTAERLKETIRALMPLPDVDQHHAPQPQRERVRPFT